MIAGGFKKGLKKKKEGRFKKFQVSTRRRACRFCVDKKLKIDYKNARLLQPFITERGRILPRRLTGNCAKHQREVTTAIKRARILAFVPFTATQVPTAL